MSIFSRFSRLAYLVEMLLLVLLIIPAVQAQDTSDRILYAVGSENGDNTIYRINVDGGAKMQMGIVRKFGSEAGWSPDGKFIYLLDYSEPNHPSLNLIDAETGQRQILPDALQAKPCSLPFDWSPNDEWLAYQTQSETQSFLKLLNLTNDETQILEDADPGYDELLWSPDSHYLAYHTVSEQSDAISIRDLQNQKTVEVIHIQSTQFLKWSPARNRIVFKPVASHDIIVYNTADDTKQQYDATDIGSWSPDGKFLTLYRQDENGQNSLLVVDVLTKTTIQLDSEIASVNVAKNAAWSFDGQYLAIITRKAAQASERTAYILDILKKSIQRTYIHPRDEDPFIWSPLVNRLVIITDIDFVGEGASFSSFWLLDVDHQQSDHYDVKIPPMAYERGLNRSATGGYMLLYTDSGLASLNWASGELTQIDTTAQRFSRPRWSPDGTRLALVTSGIINRDIYVFTPQGNQLRNITNTSDEIETFLGWRGAKNRGESLSFCGEG